MATGGSQGAFEWFACNDAGGQLPSEDRVHVRIVGQSAFVWAIDGASSVDPLLRTSEDLTGGEWHARQLSAALDDLVGKRAGHLAGQAPDLRVLLADAVATVALAFARENSLLRWPRWAFPLSAVSLAHIIHDGEGTISGRSLHLADCPAYLISESVRTLHEQVLADETRVRSGAAKDVSAALEDLKIRRIAQHDNPAPDVAGLDPACAAQARACAFSLRPGERLVMLTDGFARQWEEYRLAPRDEILTGLTDHDRVAGRIAAMRRHERTAYFTTIDRMLKSSDDAALVSIAWKQA